MTESDMITLLRSYDALRDLRTFLGVDGIGFGYDSILERLNVGGVICRHAKGYNGDVERWMLDVLDDRESSYADRARRLLGKTDRTSQIGKESQV